MSIEDKNEYFDLGLKYNLLLEYSPGLLFVHDLKGNLLDTNINFIITLGYKDKNEIRNLSMNEFIIYDKSKSNNLNLSKFIKNICNKSKYIEFELITKKKQIISVEGFGIPFYVDEKKVILNVAKNINKQKNFEKRLLEIEEELYETKKSLPEIQFWNFFSSKSSSDFLRKSGQQLLESERKYQKILENIKEGYYEIDLDGKFVFFNSSICEITGYLPEELYQLDYQKLLDQQSVEISKGILQSLLKNKNSESFFELKIIKKNEEVIFVETSFSVKYDSNGKATGFFGLSRDITERKKVEELRNRFREQLEEDVKIRTQELQEALESQKLFMTEIVKNSQFKSEFMSTMSHELRTPLNSIIGFSDLLLDQSYGVLNEEQSDFLNDIKFSCEHLLDLINHILDISKIESGELILKFKEIELKLLLDQIHSTIKPLYKEKSLFFKIEGLNNNPTIYVDIVRFKEILYNLFSNACKFTIEGGVTLKIMEKNDFWEFEVIDTGIGIEEKDYYLVFEEFKRVDSPIINSIPGTGLGLPLTKRLIHLHGGEIFSDSCLGKGSTFTFTIPKKKD
jgi:PAS domain S-box-containing protein